MGRLNVYANVENPTDNTEESFGSTAKIKLLNNTNPTISKPSEQIFPTKSLPSLPALDCCLESSNCPIRPSNCPPQAIKSSQPSHHDHQGKQNPIYSSLSKYFLFRRRPHTSSHLTNPSRFNPSFNSNPNPNFNSYVNPNVNPILNTNLHNSQTYQFYRSQPTMDPKPIMVPHFKEKRLTYPNANFRSDKQTKWQSADLLPSHWLVDSKKLSGFTSQSQWQPMQFHPISISQSSKCPPFINRALFNEMRDQAPNLYAEAVLNDFHEKLLIKIKTRNIDLRPEDINSLENGDVQRKILNNLIVYVKYPELNNDSTLKEHLIHELEHAQDYLREKLEKFWKELETIESSEQFYQKLSQYKMHEHTAGVMPLFYDWFDKKIWNNNNREEQDKQMAHRLLNIMKREQRFWLMSTV